MMLLSFYFFAALALGSSLAILFARTVLYAASFLLLTLLATAALFVLMGADLLAVIQILIYVGGVLVLLLFGIMLSPVHDRMKKIKIKKNNKTLSRRGLARQAIGFLVGGILCFILLSALMAQDFSHLVYNSDRLANETQPYMTSTVYRMGLRLMTDNLLPFELAGIILLVVLIGASTLAFRQEEENGVEN